MSDPKPTPPKGGFSLNSAAIWVIALIMLLAATVPGVIGPLVNQATTNVSSSLGPLVPYIIAVAIIVAIWKKRPKGGDKKKDDHGGH